MKINYLEIPKASLEKIREFISEAEEKVLLEMYGIEFVSLDEYKTIQDLLDAWKNSINELGIKYSGRDNDPVFNPFKKYFNTALRDMILTIGIPEFKKEEVGIYEQYHYENKFLPEQCINLEEIFIVDMENKYLYNFFDRGSSDRVYAELVNNSRRNSIFQKREFVTNNKFEEKMEKFNKELKIKHNDEFKMGLGEKSWMDLYSTILSIVFNPYINASVKNLYVSSDEIKSMLSGLDDSSNKQ